MKILIIVLIIPLNLLSENFDMYLTERIYERFTSPLSQSVMRNVTQLGDGKLTLGISVSCMLFDETKRFGKLSLYSFTLSGTTTLCTKIIFNRTRPDGGNHSFPSGHTSTAFSTATIIAYEYPKWKIPAYTAAGMVALSRIALKRHYLGDVLVGAAVGIASGWLVEKFYYLIE